ncbi:hypothetical protein K493DRAFT_374414 [Basidiobolus meristosporus CBS 931.73]|uniref:Uncharacterized protein n=1 Tax=Basidiobolus meristosporus CBS 931.73 TaxID=1314790 RepID=A0A1Y1Y8E6_9FUNG|nr:hypothetical protein K493DRAFT_374414 [Basidiobolus meristosporus CBS 931.73]|eukprot:ORX94016.1 hypothetical protein K493DRAFT_374414 [Basidiobolus meristosporus CBS 931.73]
MPSISSSCSSVYLVKPGVFKGFYELRNPATEELLYTKQRYMDNSGRDLLTKVEGKVVAWQSTSSLDSTRLEDQLGMQSPVVMQWTNSSKCDFTVDEEHFSWILDGLAPQCYACDGTLVAEINTVVIYGRKSFTIDLYEGALNSGLFVMIALKILDRWLYKTLLDGPLRNSDQASSGCSVRTTLSGTSAGSTTSFIK